MVAAWFVGWCVPLSAYAHGNQKRMLKGGKLYKIAAFIARQEASKQTR